MGIDARLALLLKNEFLTDRHIDSLIHSYERLTSNNDMGSIFKMICISSKGMPNPPGFEIIPPIKK
jgi:SAM-dependent MidA family methyltransferase